MNKSAFISLDIVLSILFFTFIILIISNLAFYTSKSLSLIDVGSRTMEVTYNRILDLEEKDLAYIERIYIDKKHKVEIEFKKKIEKEFFNIYIIVVREIDKNNKVSEYEYAKIYRK